MVLEDSGGFRRVPEGSGGGFRRVLESADAAKVKIWSMEGACDLLHIHRH